MFQYVIRRLLIAGLLTALVPVSGTAQETTVYRPALTVPDAMAPFLKQLDPGSDAFPMERQAAEIEARLRAMSDAFRAGAARTSGVMRELLDPGFRGARLLPLEAASATAGPLEVMRATNLPRDPALDARAFSAELQRLTGDLRAIAVAEFLITSIEPDGSADPVSRVRTAVRYDIVGEGTKAYRVEHVGVWDMSWRRNGSGWQVVRWTAAAHVGC